MEESKASKQENQLKRTQLDKVLNDFRPKSQVIAFITCLNITLLLWFSFEPVINFRFYGIAWLMVLFFMLCIILFSNKSIQKWSGFMIFICLLYCIFGGLMSTEMFRASSYRDQLGKVEYDSKFEFDIPEVELSRIRIIDHDVAVRLGQKILGTETSLGSQVRLGEFFIQNIKGKLYWVAPLLHSGFFKWWSNSDGTPGYVMVSATDELDVKLVENVNNKPIKIKYQTEAYFMSELTRHLYFSGFMTIGFTHITFEIDDEGNPFWVVSLYDKQIGFAGKNAFGIATIDPQTGEVKKYLSAEAPKWIDRIHPNDILQEQVRCWGEYVHGYINPSHEDQIKPTGEMILIYGEGDHCWWYQGMTSTGQDNSTVGFLLIDSRTKKVKFHKQTGATEIAAMNSAMGKVQEKGYVSSHPVAYNIAGVPTYVMALKDQAGLIKQVEMVSIHDYAIVSVGSDINEAIRNYEFELSSKGKMSNSLTSKNSKTESNISGVISRISADTRGGNTIWYFLLNNQPAKIFLGMGSVSPELPLSQPGDSVQVGWHSKNESNAIDILRFNNLKIEDPARIK